MLTRSGQSHVSLTGASLAILVFSPHGDAHISPLAQTQNMAFLLQSNETFLGPHCGPCVLMPAGHPRQQLNRLQTIDLVLDRQSTGNVRLCGLLRQRTLTKLCNLMFRPPYPSRKKMNLLPKV